ncbi:MAG: transposase [Gammaproteobacteria bacterium]|nr:transposase [Gammaproteobacteria bacterium]MYH47625.1 transposase [Gammaproteobacteria bacterium]MYH85411.1 transposase [Gammaproteobacteria bacterium]MYK04370.1 transposase [Gammaproteobacteria bacterium]MYL12192.1 transposase [Gammaproteobacteria bacterium]
MTRPRSQIVSLADTPYYHCVSRCVRRAFLCGEDRYSGKNFDHRKPWLVDRLTLLGEVFAIDIAAYAVMSNHYHVVLHVDQAHSRSWSRDEVIHRWLSLYKGNPLVHCYLRGELKSEAEFSQLDLIVETWRKRLTDISWFMRCLNEYIARRANKEDNCTGRFWEGRFKSQALLDEAALLSCMAYVDLNPIRAGICETLDESDFTSIQVRIRQLSAEKRSRMSPPPPELMPLRVRIGRDEGPSFLPFGLRDYIELVDWTGRTVRTDKKGFVPEGTPSVLSELNLSGAQWQTLALEIQKEAITMFHGLEKLATRERSGARKAE